MDPPGPKHYQLADAADVTAILYKKRTAAANHAFKKGELNEEGVEKIVADVPGITAKR